MLPFPLAIYSHTLKISVWTSLRGHYSTYYNHFLLGIFYDKVGLCSVTSLDEYLQLKKAASWQYFLNGHNNNLFGDNNTPQKVYISHSTAQGNVCDWVTLLYNRT